MAATGNEKKRDDKDPDPVIVEKSAKAVVIHKNILRDDIVVYENGVLTIILCREGKNVIGKGRNLLNNNYCKKISKPIAKCNKIW